MRGEQLTSPIAVHSVLAVVPRLEIDRDNVEVTLRTTQAKDGRPARVRLDPVVPVNRVKVLKEAIGESEAHPCCFAYAV